MTYSYPKTTSLLVAIIFCFVAVSFGQQSPQSVFDEANDELEAGNYQQAVKMYQNLEDQNNVSGALFLNQGISYQRMDSLGKAKYYFLKASKFDETEERAEKALEYVDSQFSRQSAELPKLPWDIATDWLRHNIGANNLLIIAIALLNIGVIGFVSHWFINWYPKYFRIGGLTVIGLSLIIMAASFYTNYVQERYSTAVMIAQKNPVVEQPKEEASLVGQAYEGYTFTVDHYRSDSQPGWTYVRMSNGLYGWIPDNEILIL